MIFKKFSFFKILVLILFLHGNLIIAQSSWSTLIDSVSTLSSPRAVDLNNDGIKDLVLGAGTDSTFSNYGLVAMDGSSGQLLWNLPTPDEIFTSAVFNDINNDNVADVFIGGRNAQLYAIDGSNGTILWEFFPQNMGLNPADSGLYNFYSSQICDDYDGDNVNDILVTNGGDHKAAPFDPRPPGHLMLISGANGNLISKAVSPDSAEIYSSPVILDRLGGQTPSIIFGTGGEQHSGGMYVSNFSDLISGDITNSILLTSHPSKGFIAPASIADVSDDSFLDIIVQSFSGEISAFDGITYQPLWTNTFSGCESSAAPTIGNFTGGDLIPDVFTVIYRGTTPTYFDYYQVMINGLTGEITWIDSIGSMHFSSSSAFDANGDGRDEVLFSVNYISSYFSHQLKLIDFQNDSVTDVTPLSAGVNLGCSPLIDDIDSDGLIDFIYTYKYDSLNPSAWNGFYFNKLSTNYSFPFRGIAWGAYMGTNFSGHYNRLLNICPNSNFVSSWSVNHPSCNNFNDGSVYPSIINTTPNTYLWSDGSVGDTLQNASSGIHTLFITDTNNCVEYHQFQLNDPYYISFGNVNHNNCVGDSIGTATVSSSGCVCQFSTCTYNWDNGSLIKHATNLPAGMHRVLITHPDGCMVEDSVFINDGLPVINNYVLVDNSCYNLNDASIKLYPNDSLSTIYNWSNNASTDFISQLSPGSYSVQVSNNFCNDSLFFDIISPDTVKMATQFTSVLCYGDSNGVIQLNSLSGISPFNFVLDGYIYSDSIFDNLSVGTYQVYIKDSSNCNSDTLSISINQPDSLSFDYSVIPETDSGFFDGTATLNVIGGTRPYSFFWNHLPNINDSIVVYLPNGYYSFTVNDSNGCSLSDSVYVGMLSGIDEKNRSLINIFPVPSMDKIFITNSSNFISSGQLFDISGKLIRDNILIYPNDKYELFLSKGHYFVKIHQGDTSIVKKVVIIE
ncbi:MAG: hypothetical protein CL832_06930 [Crocinitomicaceae bacterium]|nr:hypothetical protein [Crocinitomicaceae bacterium]